MKSKIIIAAGSIALFLLSSMLFVSGTFAKDSAGEPGPSSGKKNPLNNVYFGEQHLHTANSPDAFAMGVRNTPDDAYNFAKGKAVKKNTTGKMVQKKTPYDWCAVTDHAEYLGIMPLIVEKGNPMQKTPIGKEILSGDPKKGADAFQKIMNSVAGQNPIPYMSDPKVAASVWEKQKATTNKHNEPGKFTTLIAFEWTSQAMYETCTTTYSSGMTRAPTRFSLHLTPSNGRICGPTRKFSVKRGTRIFRSLITPMSAMA